MTFSFIQPNYLLKDASALKTNKQTNKQTSKQSQNIFTLKGKLLWPQGVDLKADYHYFLNFLLCANLVRIFPIRQTSFRRRWSPCSRPCSRCHSTERRSEFRLAGFAPESASFWPTTCSRTCTAGTPDSSTAAGRASRWRRSTARPPTWGSVRSKCKSQKFLPEIGMWRRGWVVARPLKFKLFKYQLFGVWWHI